ncbi:MAG: carbohydrate ABC transporter permease, partial [Oscillospiraceae bacterium]|nr:carbohydrate ABC transporter permease [Oscillospiraceae bacterium]
MRAGKTSRFRWGLAAALGAAAAVYVLPILIVVMNSFKTNSAVKTAPFAWPSGESFAGWANYLKGLTFGSYPFLRSAAYSLLITLLSTALILLCTSMAAWYLVRVDSRLCRAVYALLLFSMVVPFQMVMFTLSKT